MYKIYITHVNENDFEYKITSIKAIVLQKNSNIHINIYLGNIKTNESIWIVINP